ncbi:MAG: ATP-grasp domain-containing protein [Myxococcota bacterium]
MTRVLLTGVGGPAAISVMKALPDNAFSLFASDMDPHAAGLYLVEPERRFIIPRGDAPELCDALFAICKREAIDIVIPTVDSELEPVARERSRFEQIGTRVLLPALDALEICLDKLRLYEEAKNVVPVPTTIPVSRDSRPDRYPVIVKPRRGSGSRGIFLVSDEKDYLGHTDTPGLIAQSYLPGQEYSIDVIADSDGRSRYAVPRERMKTDSGVSVTSQTVHDEELIKHARAIVDHLKLAHVCNVQFRRDPLGHPKLLEINPRFPGTMPLTVASGINMPLLSVQHLLGAPIPDDLRFEEIAVVRYLQEVVISTEELHRLVPAEIARAS